MSKKQTVGNRQQSRQDKEIYGEVLRSSPKITPLTPRAGEAGQQNNRAGHTIPQPYSKDFKRKPCHCEYYFT